MKQQTQNSETYFLHVSLSLLFPDGLKNKNKKEEAEVGTALKLVKVQYFAYWPFWLPCLVSDS